MTRQKSPDVFLYFAIILCIPLVILLWGDLSKATDVFIVNRNNYAFTKVALIENVNKKYGDRATYRFAYQNKIIEGEDRALLFFSPGDMVTVYFNKKTPRQNGISLQLISLTIGRFLFFGVLIAYIIYKIRKHEKFDS
ncbi:hypothetical protein [Mucilaginibacter auburnensis]|uniref:DUF3592 domain-containing protein n=1 Tax=Mucilaginibacter auburnensis TaxID=1457233 RepID=A0A2H9VLL9_9SPHI|nr:hypothetical protein [Mucilaginibacter auburnensis]PJJ79213.1 hypothetical protein CLV57_2339 [Mucilaginibacter auburnensis]